MPYKWRQIGKNTLVIICILEYKNDVKHFCGSTHCFQDINISNLLACKVGQYRRANFCNCVIFWQKSESLSRSVYFTPALAVSEISTFTVFNLQKVCTRSTIFAMLYFDYKYQNLQKSSPCIFALALTVSEILKFKIFYL